MKNKARICCIYRILVIASLLMGIILNLATTSSIQFLMSYYTMQSNLLCLAVFILLLIGDFKKNKAPKSELYYAGKGLITIAILVTAIVYVTTLFPNHFPMYTSDTFWKKVGNILVHFVSPILVFVDYLAFDKKGEFKKSYPIFWTFFPIQYVGYVYSYRAKGGRFYNIGGSREFGYFFLDFKQIGVKGVIFWIIGITIAVIALGYVLVFLDKKLANRQKKKEKIIKS